MGCLKRVNNNRLYRLFHSEFIMRYRCTECTCNLHIELCGIGRERERGRYSHDRTKMQSHLFFCRILWPTIKVCEWMCVASHLYCFYSIVRKQHQFQNMSEITSDQIMKREFLWKANNNMGDVCFTKKIPIVFWQFLRRYSSSKRIGHT